MNPEDTQILKPDSSDRRRELKVSLPGGISFSLRGFDVVLMIVAASMPLMVYFIWEIKSSGAMEHNRIVEALEVQTYVMSLSSEKREALNLAMPESVRRRTIEERRRLRELDTESRRSSNGFSR